MKFGSISEKVRSRHPPPPCPLSYGYVSTCAYWRGWARGGVGRQQGSGYPWLPPRVRQIIAARFGDQVPWK